MTMAIPKKGSRLIVVDGMAYRWRVRHKPTYSQANGWGGMAVAIERADAKGAALLVQMPQMHPGNWMGAESKPVLPSDVERFIRYALSSGWRSSEQGEAFRVAAADVAQQRHAPDRA